VFIYHIKEFPSKRSIPQISDSQFLNTISLLELA